jgi:hypothetical protein
MCTEIVRMQGRGGVSGCSDGSGGPAAGFSVSHRAVVCVRFCHWRERQVGAAWARAWVFLYGCERTGVWHQVSSSE